MDWSTPIAATLFIIAIFVAAEIGVGMVLRFLIRREILAHPNERSSHSVPTPHGGGIAMVVVILGAWAAVTRAWEDPAGPEIWVVLASAGVLAWVSWLDDLRHLPVRLRLAIHVGVVAAVLAIVPAGERFFGGWLPLLPDRIGAGLLWVWFLNLFNFMDGIDGLAGSEGVTIGVGTAAVAVVADIGGGVALYALAIAAAAAGFLRWNWHPARIFMGDVGSVPLGFLLGWLLLRLAAGGEAAAALILPLYFLADATLTMSRRALRGERFWRPHREHFYQRAVQRGLSHAAVTTRILIANLALVGLALAAATGWAPVALAGSLAVVVALLRVLAGRGLSLAGGTV